ncbi:MAG TPA: RDD family protein [Candidatus Acidoferrales bacterium]|nr:RDD family protein [Candidatus Acidoferrales bacterium]
MTLWRFDEYDSLAVAQLREPRRRFHGGMPMYCSVCGSQVQDNDRFCPKCGRAMASATPAAYAAQPGTSGVPGRRIHYGGFWIRFVAAFIDGMVLSIPTYVFYLVVLAMFGGAAAFHLRSLASENQDQLAQNLPAIMAGLLGLIALMTILSLALNWLYYALMESSPRQATLGKSVLNLKVTDLNGNRISFGRATGRYFGKIVSGMAFAIGYIIAGFTEKKQALHDFMAGTVVIHTD